jgi:transcription initiation factor TFIID subunit TAF12
MLSICKQLWHDSNGQGTKVMQTIYQGHTPNLAREGVFTMVYLGLYDLISSEVKKRRHQEHDQQQQQQQQQLKLPMHEVIKLVP